VQGFCDIGAGPWQGRSFDRLQLSGHLEQQVANFADQVAIAGVVGEPAANLAPGRDAGKARMAQARQLVAARLFGIVCQEPTLSFSSRAGRALGAVDGAVVRRAMESVRAAAAAGSKALLHCPPIPRRFGRMH
jgi:hypothetical protein